VHVRRDTALPLNSALEPLEDVVRLTVDNGGVSGLAVQGTFLKTCWGSSIDFLVHVCYYSYSYFDMSGSSD
jgi:hypothetical protein